MAGPDPGMNTYVSWPKGSFGRLSQQGVGPVYLPQSPAVWQSSLAGAGPEALFASWGRGRLVSDLMTVFIPTSSLPPLCRG